MDVLESLDSPILPAGFVVATGLAWWRELLKGRRLNRTVEALHQDLHRLREDLAQTEEAASRDRLTGTWNRRYFDEVAAAEIGLARRRRAPLSLILMDLDHFKRINDTYGHPVGDAVLIEAAAAFRSVLRTSDALVRWGGEEFLVLTPATGLEGATHLAERLRIVLESTPFAGAEPMTLSAGVAEYKTEEALDAWLARADSALYRAKSEGRNRVIASCEPDSLGIPSPPNLLELVWKDAYSSGHHLIDEQHILLFDLSNALLSALLGSEPPSMTEAHLDALLRHVEKHFQDEERLLRQAHYPDLDQHRSKHAHLLALAQQLQEDMRDGHVDFGRLVAYLATDLVKGHLLTEDCHYFSHLHASWAPEGQA